MHLANPPPLCLPLAGWRQQWTNRKRVHALHLQLVPRLARSAQKDSLQATRQVVVLRSAPALVRQSELQVRLAGPLQRCSQSVLPAYRALAPAAFQWVLVLAE